MAVQAAISQEAPKKRRLPSPSQQAARVPSVRLVAPAAAKEQSLSRNFGQYAREQQMVAEAPEEEMVPDQRQLRRKIGTLVKANSYHVELEQVRRNKATLFSYAAPLAVALQKDLLDFAMIGSLPGIGSIITLCFSLLIFLLIHFSRSESRLMGSRFILRAGLTMIFGSIVEGFAFGLNFLPIETMVVFLIYIMDKNMSDDRIRELLTATRHFKGA
jgi:hypothetical protein